ncbi:MAG TPA: hypothetical protein VKB88_32395 [Bryobacteraceae bacterium]|nr:hypothetical protein [Bryobacteraceae bacterium]
MSDSPRLPARPSLQRLQEQAKDLLRQVCAGDPSAVNRPRAILPALGDSVALADAQFTLAREYGLENWAGLKHFMATAGPPQTTAYRVDTPEKRISSMAPYPITVGSASRL